MTIIRVTTGNGSRRCDSNCHHAKTPVCRCVCGGRYHGTKLRASELITQDLRAGYWAEVSKVQAMLDFEGAHV